MTSRTRWPLAPLFPSPSVLTLGETARLAGLHPDLVERLVDLGLIDPLVWEPRPLFSRQVVVRLRRIERLRRDFAASYTAMGLVMELLDRIEVLQRRLREHDGQP